MLFLIRHDGIRNFSGQLVAKKVQPRMIMKVFLIFIATLIGILCGATFVTGNLPDAALIFAAIIPASLIAWTAQQYERKYPPLFRAQILRPTSEEVNRRQRKPVRRIAA